MGRRRRSAGARRSRRSRHELRLSRRCRVRARCPVPGGDLPTARPCPVDSSRASSRWPRRWPTLRRCWTGWAGRPPTWWATRGEATWCSTRRLAIPDRLAGVLSVDPLGAVGDGGGEAFGAGVLARVPDPPTASVPACSTRRSRSAGNATPEEVLEAFSLFWASYFADPAAAPADAAHRVCSRRTRPCGLICTVRLTELESSLPSITVPFGVIVGGLSPMPPSAGDRERRAHPWGVVARRAWGRAIWSGMKRRAAFLRRWTDCRGPARGGVVAQPELTTRAEPVQSGSVGVSKQRDAMPTVRASAAR